MTAEGEKIEGLPVAGYRPQSPEAVATVNASKELEEHVLRLLDEIGEDPQLQADKHWLSIGRTAIEQGFMAVNRSVFKPARMAIAELDGEVVESGWVIERADSPVSAPLYYFPYPHGAPWTEIHLNALRLARKEDAERVASVLTDKVRIAFHEWSGA